MDTKRLTHSNVVFSFIDASTEVLSPVREAEEPKKDKSKSSGITDAELDELLGTDED